MEQREQRCNVAPRDATAATAATAAPAATALPAPKTACSVWRVAASLGSPLPLTRRWIRSPLAPRSCPPGAARCPPGAQPAMVPIRFPLSASHTCPHASTHASTHVLPAWPCTHAPFQRLACYMHHLPHAPSAEISPILNCQLRPPQFNTLALPRPASSCLNLLAPIIAKPPHFSLPTLLA